MCGRFTQMRSWSELVALYRISENVPPRNVPARYNVAPTQEVAAVRLRRATSERELVLMRWGLVPFWAKDIKVGYRMINARAETVARLPAFREAFKRRRCLIPADGFYEWQKTGGGRKQPYFITSDGERPVTFAGLCETWKSPQEERIESCAIIVTEANELIRPIHDRMPVILDPEDFDMWLDLERGGEEAQRLLKPYEGELTVRPVSTRVNNVRNDDPGLIERAAIG